MLSIPDYQINNMLKLYSGNLERHTLAAQKAPCETPADIVSVSDAITREVIVKRIVETISKKIDRMRLAQDSWNESGREDARVVPLSPKPGQGESSDKSASRFKFVSVDGEGYKSVQVCLIDNSLF